MGSHDQQNYVKIYVHQGGLGWGINVWRALLQLDYEFYKYSSHEGDPFFSNEALSKESDVAPLIFSSSLFLPFIYNIWKKWILECISSTVIMWDIKRFPQNVGMIISGD